MMKHDKLRQEIEEEIFKIEEDTVLGLDSAAPSLEILKNAPGNNQNSDLVKDVKSVNTGLSSKDILGTVTDKGFMSNNKIMPKQLGKIQKRIKDHPAFNVTEEEIENIINEDDEIILEADEETISDLEDSLFEPGKTEKHGNVFMGSQP